MQAGFCAAFLQPLFRASAKETELCVNQTNCVWGILFDLCEGQTCFFCCDAPGKWGRKKLFCVLGIAGVGVILFIFKLSSINLPGTDALLGWGNPFEAHQENTSSGSSYTVPVLWLFSAGHIQGQGNIVLSNGRTWLKARCNLNSSINYCR